MFIDGCEWCENDKDMQWESKAQRKMDEYAKDFIAGVENIWSIDKSSEIAHFFALSWFENDELAVKKAKEYGFQDIEFYAALEMFDEFCTELNLIENEG